MTPRKLLRAIATPITESAVLLTIVLFTGLLWLGMAGGPIGIVVIILCLPPIFRYQMLIVEDCARGVSPGALDAEFFNLIGGAYSFFPLVLAVAYAAASYYAYDAFGIIGPTVVLFLAGALFPASLALLAITRSPLQSVNPVAIYRLFKTTGGTFWFAPMYTLVAFEVLLRLGKLPLPVAIFIGLFLMFSLAAVCGSLIAPARLVDEVDIPEPLAPTREKLATGVEQHRLATLSHAYSFISRDNREGGFKHVMAEIERDPDPQKAWLWYLDNMFKWEQQRHALFFAQHVIHDMLAHNEQIPALKLIMRCRLVNEEFRPARDDLPAALRAAEKHGNTELAAVLKRG